MPDAIITSLTALINVPPVLVAGVLALIGLLLWSAGVKVARAVSASVMGAALAGVGWAVLPSYLNIAPEFGALIGLLAGLIIGALTLRALQGAVLAIALALAVSGGYYQWQINKWTNPYTHTSHVQTAKMSTPPPAAVPATPFVALQQMANQRAVEIKSRWDGIPMGLRQSMAVIGGGVAVLILLLSWQVPRYTTWLVSAAVGTGLLLLGGIGLMQIYVPGQVKSIPPPQVLAAIAGAVTLAGMLVQRLFFWPGRRQQQERAKDRSGETVPAV